jgi:hypothetical protein
MEKISHFLLMLELLAALTAPALAAGEGVAQGD